MAGKLSEVAIASLGIFVRAARLASMSAAARELGLTQPTVTNTIHRLEAIVGADLLDRHARPMRLTPQGRLLLERAEELLATVEGLEKAIRDVSGQSQPELRLGFSDTFAAVVSPDLLPRILDLSPNLAAYSDTTPGILEKLHRGEVDIAVATRPASEDPNVVSVPLATERFLVATPPGFAGALHSAADLRQVALKLPAVRFNGDSLDGTQIERILRRCQPAGSPRIQADSNDSVLSLVSQGLGWTVIPPLGLWAARARARDVVLHDVVQATRTFYLQYKSVQFERAAGTVAAISLEILDRLVHGVMPREMPLAARSIRLEPAVPASMETAS